MIDILLSNGEYVITVDPKRRIITNGSVAIDNGEILDIGKSTDINKKYQAATVIDARDKVIMPGLIDGHAHPAQYLSKGIADDIDVVTWVYKRMFPFESELMAHDAYVCGLGEFCEMIKHGTTCHNNPGVPGPVENSDMVAKAMKETGMRGIVARYNFDMESLPDFPVPKKFLIPTEEQLAMSEEVVKKWNGAENDLIRAWYGWRLPYNASDKLITESKRLADKYGVGIHTHANMDKGEEAAITKKWGKRTLARYEELGVMGPNMYMAHMGWTSWEELDMLQKYNVKVSHTPTASMHACLGEIAHGKFPEMVEKGIVVTLGHDSVSAGRTLDMFMIMYVAACGHKDARLDPLVIGPYKALEMATIDCAKGLLWEDKIGSLEIGKKADVITIDMNNLEWWPMWDVVANLVYSADGGCVDNVIIDGRVVMRDKKILTVSEKEVLAQVKETAEKMKGRLDITIPSKWPVV